MDSGFDWDVIQRSLPYLFREGMTFTVTLTLLVAMTLLFGYPLDGVVQLRRQLVVHGVQRVGAIEQDPGR